MEFPDIFLGHYFPLKTFQLLDFNRSISTMTTRSSRVETSTLIVKILTAMATLKLDLFVKFLFYYGYSCVKVKHLKFLIDVY